MIEDDGQILSSSSQGKATGSQINVPCSTLTAEGMGISEDFLRLPELTPTASSAAYRSLRTYQIERNPLETSARIWSRITMYIHLRVV